MENIFGENAKTDGKSVGMNTIKYVLQHKTILCVREREEMYTLLYISAKEKGYGDEGKDRETTGWGVQEGAFMKGRERSSVR